MARPRALPDVATALQFVRVQFWEGLEYAILIGTYAFDLADIATG